MKNKIISLSDEKIDKICLLAFAGNNDDTRDYISTLDKIELAELMALMWLGRSGRHDLSVFQELFEWAQNSISMKNSPGYITGKLQLETYLRDGLKLLK
jgi:hypothetical protein